MLWFFHHVSRVSLVNSPTAQLRATIVRSVSRGRVSFPTDEPNHPRSYDVTNGVVHVLIWPSWDWHHLQMQYPICVQRRSRGTSESLRYGSFIYTSLPYGLTQTFDDDRQVCSAYREVRPIQKRCASRRSDQAIGTILNPYHGPPFPP